MRTGLKQLSLALTESTSLKHVMASPAFSIEEKLGVLSSVSERLGCPSQVKGFLGQLVAKSRVDQLEGIAEAFGELADQVKGDKQVTVTSAKPLSKSERDRIHERLRGLIKGGVVITYHTNPNILSGLHIQVGSMVFDNTIRNRFDAIRISLAKE